MSKDSHNLTVFPSYLFFALVILCASPALSNVSVQDTKLGYTFELPDGFVEDSRLLQGAHPDVVRAFSRGSFGDTKNFLVILVSRMHGTIGQEPINPSDMPAGFNGQCFKTPWQGFEIDVFEVVQSANGNEFVTYNSQIPLRREAIQIGLLGPAIRKAEIKLLLPTVLSGLHGESNWNSSPFVSPSVEKIPSAIVPPSVASSRHYGTVLLIVMIVCSAAGLIALWFISTRTPKGTVLIISASAYLLGALVGLIRTRETLMLSAIAEAIGVTGAILGVVDVLRKRKSPATIGK
jgi:hypothetical protein